jgi:hypothetical protein
MLHQADFLTSKLVGKQTIDTALTRVKPTLCRDIRIQSLDFPVGQQVQGLFVEAAKRSPNGQLKPSSTTPDCRVLK